MIGVEAEISLELCQSFLHLQLPCALAESGFNRDKIHRCLLTGMGISKRQYGSGVILWLFSILKKILNDFCPRLCLGVRWSSSRRSRILQLEIFRPISVHSPSTPWAYQISVPIPEKKTKVGAYAGEC